MLIFPAIDLYEGKAVRLYQGDYAKMTVYSDDPVGVARAFKKAGAGQVHLVDLEGAKNGGTPNIETILKIKRDSSLFCEVGGGVRSPETVARYLDGGVDRVILGTAAVKDRDFLCRAVETYGEKVAVGVDIKDGKVAVSGWTEDSGVDALSFCEDLRDLGVQTLVCTDISRDGAMRGVNLGLYRELSGRFSFQVIASGGVSAMDDLIKLKEIGLYGAIIGKAYYTGAIDLASAIGAAK